jgi:hypothetical protein
MNKTLLSNIVDMTTFVSSGVHFNQVYGFDNGMQLVVSRNAMTGGSKSGHVAVLPVGKDGKDIYERAEEWLTALQVAEKMAVIAEE